MNQRSQRINSDVSKALRGGAALDHSRREAEEASGLTELLLGNEMVELCSEIAGALLRGYADGKSGRAMRCLIVAGLIEKMRCKQTQAESLVDLSLELIHLQAYGKFSHNPLELSLLVARGGGEVGELSSN